ncbi:hypothetical protein [Methanosphaera sp.]|uniref:hypothetical protein n=1 Tax=Methanosphaera sp. TaxID=2666342 RepID=UPI0025E46669|nr:hypothetical protein [Methanosphaera sp.]
MDKFSLFDLEQEEVDSKYTAKISIPQYLPKAECPSIYELVSTIKYDELVSDIINSSVTDEQKEFLLKAATRHLVFNYAKIADYYAHQDKEMQELMEKSALVLIDFEDAIANGYAKLDHRIVDLALQQYSVKEKLGKG